MAMFLQLSAIALVGALVSACSQAELSPTSGNPAPAAHVMTVPPTTSAPTTAIASAGLPLVTVHKSPTCGCCKLWVTHLQHAGFPVQVVEAEDLTPIKAQVGVPPGRGSCHTAQVDGYFVEGHVPADDIVRLLTERPDARGLALPGMPVGSLGMEVSSGAGEPYTVQLVARDGTTTAFSHHGQ